MRVCELARSGGMRASPPAENMLLSLRALGPPAAVAMLVFWSMLGPGLARAADASSRARALSAWLTRLREVLWALLGVSAAAAASAARAAPEDTDEALGAAGALLVAAYLLEAAGSSVLGSLRVATAYQLVLDSCPRAALCVCFSCSTAARVRRPLAAHCCGVALLVAALLSLRGSTDRGAPLAAFWATQQLLVNALVVCWRGGRVFLERARKRK